MHSGSMQLLRDRKRGRGWKRMEEGKEGEKEGKRFSEVVASPGGGKSFVWGE